MYKRLETLAMSSEESCFLWGARQTGKSTLLKNLFPGALYFDLLLSGEYRRFMANPGLIREECNGAGLTKDAQEWPVIIDEVQKVPELLDEIHWLIVNMGLRFVLCGSSPRKLKRNHANLLGGRALRYELFPLTYPEIDNFSLDRALNHGLLPRHYDSNHPEKLLQAYVGDYLQEEIASEALSRNIPAFNRFLEVAAISNGEMVNYHNIARDCGITSPTVKSYFTILEDTLIGRFIPAYRKRVKRKLIHAPKFYFFDIGLTGHLTRRGKVEQGSELFGKTFEHFISLEVIAHSSYSGKNYPISYWRTTSGFEVDLILGENDVAIEIKSSSLIHTGHLKGLRAFKEEYKGKYLIVSNDPRKRMTDDGIIIMPWQNFLDDLWANKIF